jgi:hypothetical protein
MKRSMLKVALSFLTLLGVAQVSRPAAADGCSGLFCENTSIWKLYPAGDVVAPKVFVRPTDGGQAALTCTPVSGVYLTLKATHPMFKEIYASLLEATIHNRKVDLRVIAGSPDCEIGYVVLENP